MRERCARDEADAAAGLGSLQRCPEPRGAAADDGDVEVRIFAYRRSASRRIASTCPRSHAAAPSLARASVSASAPFFSATLRSASSTLFSALSAWASISVSLAWAAAIASSLAERLALQLLGVAATEPLQLFLGALLTPLLDLGLESLKLGGRALFRRRSGPCRLLQSALCLLSLEGEVAAGIAAITHREPIY